MENEIKKYLSKLEEQDTVDSPVIDAIGIPQYHSITSKLITANEKAFHDVAYTEQIKAKETEDLKKEKQINKKEIKELNKIEGQTRSSFNKQWTNALKCFFSRDYEQSLDIFKKLMTDQRNMSIGKMSDMNYFIGYIYYKKGDYIESNNYYDEAIKYDSAYKRHAFNMKGINFVFMAKMESDKCKQIILYNKAIAMYNEAVILDNTKYHAFYNWGYALMLLAKLTKDIEEKKKFYQEALDKNEKVTFMNPDFLFAHDRVGCCYGYLANFSPEGLEKEILFDRGFEKCRFSAESESRCYNFACFLALKKEKNEALKWLKKSLERKDVDFDWIDEDKDWDNYRDDEAFKQLRSLFL